jgi:MOSC domain-containing protein YiiM
MRLLSVNIGVPRSNDWDKQWDLTGIDKQPVDGPVAVAAPGPIGTGKVGLAGDRVFDLEYHGGDDAAVYSYAREDYEFWETKLDRPLRAGVFGENFTTVGVDVSGALIGERWRVGPDLVLQVTSARTPCGTFRGWMQEKGWLKTFTDARKPGAYLRVVTPGSVSPGDTITIEHRPDHDLTISDYFAAVFADYSLRPKLLEVAEVPEPAKQWVREYLAKHPK